MERACALDAEEGVLETAAVMESAVDAVGDPSRMIGVVPELGALPVGAVVTENALAKMFNRHVVSIKRAVARGEFPPPTRLLGGNCWTVGSILQKRLDIAQKEAEKATRKFEAMKA